MSRRSLFILSLSLFALPAAAQQQVTCADKAQSVTGPAGTSAVITCPAGCGAQGVWGTNSYSDDSSMCAAAIHAGILTPAGGQARITIAGGQSAYPASTQNGVTSRSWGRWGRSFTISPVENTVSCQQNARSLPGEVGARLQLSCPAGCSGSVWGSGIYSDDSSVCTAAVHAGVLPAGRAGVVTITIAPGQPNYPASTANGITTRRWGNWNRSFIVSGGSGGGK